MTAHGKRGRDASRRSGAGTVRIIGGTWRSRVLPVVDAAGLRPTSSRVRETLFNWLAHAFPGGIEGRAVLDLFAGSGALGLEAASRGAASVWLVERDTAALDNLERARTTLDARQVVIRAGDALDVAVRLGNAGSRFDVVFLDPPFGQGWLARALPLAAPLLTDTGYLYVESEFGLDEAALAPLGLTGHRAGKAGDVFYHLLQRKNNDRSGDPPCSLPSTPAPSTR